MSDPRSTAEPVDESPTKHGLKAIIAAFLANLGIAIAKFVGFAFTGSGSMLAEGVHSVADTGNQLLLLFGGHRARRRANEEHPFGFGRERFFWAFMVAIVLFTLGAAFAIYDGVDKLRHPHRLEDIWWAVGILGVAFLLEATSLRTALRESRASRPPGTRLWSYIRNAKAPEIPVVLLEDMAAITGLGIAFVAVVVADLTHQPRWDGAGTVAIGVLLGVVALVLASEMKSLLIGESASSHQQEAIRAALLVEPAVVRLIHLRTEHLGPEELLVAAKVEFLHELTLPEVAEAVNRVEANVRANVPEARVMYIEPDVSRDRIAPPLVAEHVGMTVREWIAETTGQLEAFRRTETAAASKAATDDDDLDELLRPADIPDATPGLHGDDELDTASGTGDAADATGDDEAEASGSTEDRDDDRDDFAEGDAEPVEPTATDDNDSDTNTATADDADTADTADSDRHRRQRRDGRPPRPRLAQIQRLRRNHQS